MAQFTTLEARMMPLPVDNIDTDQIIPARFLKVTDKNGLGQVLFCDWRYTDEVPYLNDAEGAELNTGFALNDPTYDGARVLVAGDNFGCGSSREHAPWALVAYGFRAIIAPSFADIFRNNALKNGLLPIAVDEATYHDLLDLLEEAPQAEIKIDLAAQSVSLPGGQQVPFEIDGFAKACLLKGVDQLGYLQSFIPQIEAYEEARHAG